MDYLNDKGCLAYDTATNYYLWSKDVDSLKNFISKILDDASIASTVINEDKLHKMQSFKTQDCTVKFYITTQKVLIQGLGSSSLTKALSEFLEGETGKSEVEGEVTEDNGGNEASQVNSINGKVDEFIASAVPIDISDEESNTCDCSKLKSDLLNVIKDMDKVKQDILNITTKNMPSKHEEDLNKLYRENIRLNDEIRAMRETMSIQNNTIQNLQQEKSSLITALRILNTPESKEPIELTAEVNEHQVTQQQQQDSRDALLCPKNGGENQVNKKKKKKKKKQNQTEGSTEKSAVRTQTGHTASSPLSVDDNTTTKNNKKSVYILGDSMIKGLKPWKMSRDDTEINKRCFPGASTEDMESYMLPSLRTEPDEIIVHVGTNDVCDKTPRQLAEGVVNLCENMSQNSTATVAISSIINRADDEELNKKVIEANKILKSFAKDRNWGFIDNSRISKNYLNNKGLHLNANGTAALAKNIISYLYNSH